MEPWPPKVMNDPEFIHGWLIDEVNDRLVDDWSEQNLLTCICPLPGKLYDMVSCPICGNTQLDLLHVIEETVIPDPLDKFWMLEFKATCGSEWHIIWSHHTSSTIITSIDIKISCQELTHIYFIEAAGLDRIKIGQSKDPQRRLSELSTGSAIPLRFLASFRGVPLYEQVLHEVFAFLRLDGEWFHASQQLRNYIAYVVTLPQS